MMHESSLKSSPSSSNTYSDEQIHEQKDGTIVPLWNFHNTLSKNPTNKDFQEIFLADASAGARIRTRDINVLVRRIPSKKNRIEYENRTYRC